MDFTTFLLTSIAELFNIPPVIVLCYLPFYKTLAKPARIIAVQIGAAWVLMMALGFGLDAFGFYGFGDVLGTLFVVGSFFYFRKTVSEAHQKRNFIFFIGFYAGGMAHGIRHFLNVMGLWGAFTVVQATFILIAICIIVYLIVGFILHRVIAVRMRRVKARDMDYLWIIPFLFSILTYFYIVGYNLVGIAIYAFPIVFLMFSVISFVVFIMLMRMLERAGINAQLEVENAALDRLSRIKSEYMANLTHETKTPLTVISTHAQRAREIFEEMKDENNVLLTHKENLKADSEAVIKSLDIVQEETMRLSRFAGNALWLASTQESREQMKLNMGLFLTRSTEAYRSVIEKQGNTLTVHASDHLPNVFSKSDQLVQVMINLLTNANSHTKNGIITVEATSENEFVKVTITDNGRGIDPELLPHVFLRGVTDGGGTGMGLPISKNIIESHGGKIAIDSELGKGTAVTFWLPVYDDREVKPL